MRPASTTFVFALFLPTLAAAQSRPDMARAEPLDPYISCHYSNRLAVVSTIRLPGQGLRYRTVATSKGEKRVSVIDGYRLMISQGEPSYFANMKVEKSDPSQYTNDKDAVIKNLEFAKQSAPPSMKTVWEHTPYNGFDVYALADDTMDGNGPNGMYVLFRDSSQTIVTIYFLGQQPQDRKFKTIDEHDALVEKMIEELTLCANNPAPPVLARTVPALRTSEEFYVFVTNYYLKPRPDYISDAIGMLSASGALQIPEAVGPMMGFFSEVFAANPSRLAEWQLLIGSQSGLAKSALDTAMSWSKNGGVLQLPGHSAQMNDLYWGAFFASGNAMYVKKLLEVAPLRNDQHDFIRWSAGATAMWSLASNARQHALVRTILERETRTAGKHTRQLINELLTRDPEQMRMEIVDTYAKHKAAGRWK